MTPPKPTLENRAARILIVEDEPMLAFVLEELLLAAGYVVVAVAGRLEAALAIVTGGACDAAILDTNLAGVSAAPVASALASHGTPFLVLSGYSADQMDKAFSGAPYLQKPCRPDRITQALKDLLAKP